MRRYLLESLIVTLVIAALFAAMILSKLSDPRFQKIVAIFWVPALVAVIGGPFVAGCLAFLRSRNRNSN